MTARRRVRVPGARLGFSGLVAFSLVVAAVAPLAFLGFLVIQLTGQAASGDAVDRARRAGDTAAAVAAREAADLDSLVRDYTEWQAFASQLEADDLEPVRNDVLQFLVDRGAVAAGIVATDGGRVVAGDPAVVAALIGSVGRPGDAPFTITVDGRVYLADNDPVPAPDGDGIVGELVLATALDSRFASEVADLTGFASAVLNDEGAIAVATDTQLAGAGRSATEGAPGIVAQGGGVVAIRTNVVPGDDMAQVLLASQLGSLQAAAVALPSVVQVLLLAATVFALLVAALLARVLGQRLRFVTDGLAAIADGRVPPSAENSGGDDIGRVASGLDRLVRTLDARETTLRRCLAAAGAVPIHLTPSEAAVQLEAATVDIFGVAWCRIEGADGTPLGAAAARPATPRIADAAMDLGTDERRMVVGVPADRPWTDGDLASLEVMALLAGGVLTEADAYTRAAGRADRLDRLNRLQKEFLRSISHNLRAPLATIELAATDIGEQAADPFVRERADAIRTEERRLARLVTQVLTLSRIETGTLQLDGEPLALAPMARRIAAELAIGDRVEVADRAPGVVAFADGGAVEQIAWILLDNAHRYAPDGPIRVEVELVPDNHGAGPLLRLAVEDEGPGVAPEDRRRIFQRFVRGGASKGTDGTGLGLSVARGLARALGGDLAYRAARGARFELTLPAELPDETAPAG